MANSHNAILVIDDDTQTHYLVQTFLEGVADKIIAASNGPEGVELAQQLDPSVILLDIFMPGMDGMAVCRNLRDLPTTIDIPILFITSDTNTKHLAAALELGGVDYINKPFDPIELRARVRSALRTRKLIDILKSRARLDTLTGLENRSYLHVELAAAAAEYIRHGRRFAVLMLDLDHFKQLNDAHGHLIGDEVLRQVGACIQNAIRPMDVAFRYGGEEFLIIFRDMNDQTAAIAAGNLMKRLRQMSIVTPSGPVQITASGGVASVQGESMTCDPTSVVSAADQALYQSKHNGRDRLTVAASTPALVR